MDRTPARCGQSLDKPLAKWGQPECHPQPNELQRCQIRTTAPGLGKTILSLTSPNAASSTIHSTTTPTTILKTEKGRKGHRIEDNRQPDASPWSTQITARPAEDHESPSSQQVSGFGGGAPRLEFATANSPIFSGALEFSFSRYPAWLRRRSASLGVCHRKLAHIQRCLGVQFFSVSCVASAAERLAWSLPPQTRPYSAVPWSSVFPRPVRVVPLFEGDREHEISLRA